MPSLIDHLEKYLGRIEVGWQHDADGRKMPFRVVRLSGGTYLRAMAFATVKLARFELHAPTNGMPIRHELMMLVRDDLRDGPVPGILQQVAQEALESKHAYLHGDVISPRGPLFSGSRMEALYVAPPIYYPDEFAVCEEEGRDIVIAWLVPIAADEARYVRANGWSAFEDRLLETDPDLLDVHRAPLPI